jgi:hypothetical protein
MWIYADATTVVDLSGIIKGASEKKKSNDDMA